MYYINRLLHYTKAAYRLQSDEVLLSSFPKSGNTWVRYFMCNYLSEVEWGGKVIDFKELDSVMPGFGADNFFNAWNHSAIPKCSATHLKNNFFLNRAKTVLILRDPKDVMVSYFHFYNNRNPKDSIEDFGLFIRHRKLGLVSWFEHYKSWIDKADIIIHYEDLLSDDLLEFEKLFCSLNIQFQLESLKNAVLKSRFKKFREVEKKYGHPKSQDDTFDFTRKGIAGDHVRYFSDQDYQYYQGLSMKYQLSIYQSR